MGSESVAPTGQSIRGLEPRTKSRVIAGGEWRLAWVLDVNGHQVDAGELRYADSYLASQPANVGRLVAMHLEQQAAKQVKRKRARK